MGRTRIKKGFKCGECYIDKHGSMTLLYMVQHDIHITPNAVLFLGSPGGCRTLLAMFFGLGSGFAFDFLITSPIQNTFQPIKVIAFIIILIALLACCQRFMVSIFMNLFTFLFFGFSSFSTFGGMKNPPQTNHILAATPMMWLPSEVLKLDLG